MNFLRKSYLWIFLIGAVSFWFYSDFTRKTTCEETIKYTLGTFDSRFNISKTDFTGALKEAENVWEGATGKDLFAYDSEPVSKNRFYLHVGKYFVREAIPVNLVYDERQELSEERRSLIFQVNEAKESVSALKQKIDALKSKYQQASAEYEALLAEYRKRKTEWTDLEAKRLDVNRIADELNVLVKKHNALVGEANTTVKTINQTAGQEFEEGQYIYDAEGERINIYEFGSRAALVRVLAHELGHALGLAHNENPQSVMYYLNNSNSLTLSKDDMAALNLICKGK